MHDDSKSLDRGMLALTIITMLNQLRKKTKLNIVIIKLNFSLQLNFYNLKSK